MGMVVRTNTMALNAYRQLGLNNNAVAKSLEKLASGYRINRAGDDAAGLAISEKMKAQITGLETASANAQDGISLIQTAEGNLNEVHDMLNRMVELSTKSANGTYTSQERQALQDEMDQLLDEIDRISQSANFNGRKLLDGSMSGAIKATKQVDMIETANILTDGQLAKTPKPGIYSIDFSNASVTNRKDDGSAHFDAAATTAANTSANLLTNIDFTTDTTTVAGTVLAAISGTINIGGVSVDLADAISNVATDGTGNVKAIKDAIVAAFQAGVDDVNTANSNGSASYNEIDKTSAAAAVTANGGFTINYTTTAKTYVPSQPAASTDLKFNIFGKELDLADAYGGTIPADVTIEGNDLAELVAKAWNNLTDKQLFNVDTKATVVGGKVVFTMNEAPVDTLTPPDASKGAFVSGEFIQNNGHEITVTVEQEPAGTVSRLYGQAQATLVDGDIQDGTTLKIGDTTYVFAVGANSKYKDADNAVDLTDLRAGLTGIAAEAAKRLSTAAADNKNFKVGTTLVDGELTFTEKEGGVDYTKNNLAGGDNLGTYNVGGLGATPAPVGTKDATAEDWAGLIQLGMVDTASKSSALTLQIGDTADSYNKMRISVADMSASGLGLAGLKKTGIMTEESASAAIDTIKNAINSVSSTRAGLGALQNRLEHTINNLDVSAENLSAANSRIRDTDMAKEMMNYTKMNVLVQSAQAMLAQANQQPQSVLQLLQ